MNATRADQLPTFDLPPPPPGARLSYAIAFDLHVESLREHYSATSPTNAYGLVRSILEDEGFAWRQGSVYFGNEAVNAVTCVLTTQRLATELPWFSKCITDIRMLRIEELDDLRPAIEAVAISLRS